MPALQVVGQVIAALVAALGATGYILVLGAIVLWIRLREAGFSREVPLSLASREELIVLGAQALAVWFVLAVALVALAARMMTAQSLGRRDVAADIVLGISVTAATQAAIDGGRFWITAGVTVLLAVSIGWVLVAAVRIRPPLATWAMPVLAAAIGVLLPFAVHTLGDQQGVGTVLAGWVAFGGVILFLPSLRAQRVLIAANTAAVNRLEMERADLAAPAGAAAGPPPERLRVVNRLLASLREHLAADRTRFWLRGIAVGIAGLLMLGAIGVASQFEKQHLFRAATVSLNTGRCVKATYLSRSKDQIVLGDQVGYERRGGKLVRKKAPPPNRVVVVPASEVLELQIKDPTETGIPMTSALCGKEALIAPDGSQVEPFRGPPGPKGDKGDPGANGRNAP